MPTRKPYLAHPILGLLKWNDAEGQYRQARPEDGYPNEDEFPEIQREADRLNSESLPRPYQAWVQLVPGEF